ncbi:DNA alkylation repair protein [Vibrio hannami]|uniref:DNA alkylation repair protein n=1 Tax=Vibrio hannami TaxID=2717094 RepID=UPI002410AF57|nr:DNA alkylation repair protein [Vibrio hannami]MDG3085176.1 DNA alkylation repair protein [Vibrio hannami]
MDSIGLIEQELREIGYPTQGVRTSQIRSISAKVFRALESKEIYDVFEICENLLKRRDWALGVIAYDWAFRVKKQYTIETFTTFENWLFEYVTDWGDCDDFCTHAFGELIRQHNELFERVLNWVHHDNYAVQRAAAVILIYPINKGFYDGLRPLQIADLLLKNEHHLVQKGYGWLLKVLSKKELQLVVDYLRRNYTKMPRTAFRYALENLDKQTRQELMSL